MAGRGVHVRDAPQPADVPIHDRRRRGRRRRRGVQSGDLLQAMSAPCIVLRTTGGEAIGLGHVRRSLALADALRTLGAEPTLALVGDERALGLIRAAGFEVSPCAVGADAVAVLARSIAARVVVVDDYAMTASELAGLATGFFV